MTTNERNPVTTTTATYLALDKIRLSRPRHYRVGVEARMRNLWNRMNAAERAVIDAAWEGRA